MPAADVYLGSSTSSRRDYTDTAVVIVGGGIGGMCVAIDLIKRNNCRDFVILEKSAGVGGVWSVSVALLWI
jgi:cation diffusion facilitator CzcD-associated flavoprotein CzcO